MQKFLGKEFLINIIEEFPEAILLCTNNKIIFANKKFLSVSKYPIEEVLNKKIEDIIVFNEESVQEDSESKNVVQAELLVNNKSKIPSRVNLQKIGSVSIFCIIPLCELACLNQAHLDFVSTVSHELRTPLTSIKGFADTILASRDQLSEEQRFRFVTIIRDQVNRLTRLVEELLTVSRLEAKKDSSVIKEVDLVKFIEPIIQAIKQKEPEHIFKIKVTNDLPKIYTDKDKLEQIMTNLVDNAAKYSPKGSVVTLKINYKNNEDEKIEIKIIDEGVGIPEKHLSKIFTKFSRIDNPLTRQVQGTGLGLYITKTLVERLKGKILVESDVKGSVFTVELPVSNYEKQMSEKFVEQVVE